MALTSGTKLGPYEIQSPLGAGGMGEVYRARDTRLDRVVAVKVLPQQFQSDSDLTVRFEREARAISYLPMGQGNSTSEQLRRESTEPRKRKRESYDHCSQIRDSPLGISVWDIVDLAG